MAEKEGPEDQFREVEFLGHDDTELRGGDAQDPAEFQVDAGKCTVVDRGSVNGTFVNGQKVADGRIERTQPFIFSADETEDVGEDLGTPVSEDYKQGDNTFAGTIDKVTIAVTPSPAEVQKEEEREDAVIDEGIN